MPPKPRNFIESAKTASTSRDVIPRGARHAVGQRGGAKESKEKSTTPRALILRNGKYGAMGTGEMVLAGRISGQEKLELLGEDIMQNAVKAPFHLDISIKIAHARMDVYLDEINNMRDPEFSFHTLDRELRALLLPKTERSEPDLMRDPSWVAEQVGACIHNKYMLASAWKHVAGGLKSLEDMGLHDSHIRDQLQSSHAIRTLYLAVYNMVLNLVALEQQRLRTVAQYTPHFARYFKVDQESNPQDPQVQFAWAELRTVYKSFVDSIVIELCLPGSKFPPQVLYSCLHDSAEESPKELKRFPQAMWDVVGDLADAVRLLDLLETPLLTPQGEIWKQTVPTMPKDFELWEDAQVFSANASKALVASYQKLVFPLSNLKAKASLDKVWKCINATYIKESGKDIDTLWQLDIVQNRSPQWTTLYSDVIVDSDSDEPGGPPAKTIGNKALVRKGKSASAARNGDDDYADMPGLQSVSDSSDENGSDTDSSDASDDDDDGGESDGGYDTDEEDDMRELYREAMDTAAEMPEIFDSSSSTQHDRYAEERKKNPFLKLLGNLRGRMFSSSTTLRTSHRDASRYPYPSTVPPEDQKSQQAQPDVKAKAPTRSRVSDDDDVPPLIPIDASVQGQAPRRTTVQEVVDEDNVPKPDKKKKKKKKKKKNSDAASVEQTPSIDRPQTPVSASPLNPASSPSNKPANGQTPPKKAPSTSSPVKSPVKPPVGSPTVNGPFASTTSLSLPHTQTAQSARSYLQSEKLTESKAKVKSRPDYVAAPPPDKKGLSSKLGPKTEPKKDPAVKSSNAKPFMNLRAKVAAIGHRLFGVTPQDKGSVRWEDFLKFMQAMGFGYDPSTAGSSVRFDPPNPEDESITFHKPHPDSTLYSYKLKEFSKRLKKQYGWADLESLGSIKEGTDSEID